jgi:hypothetical protein
MAFNESSISPSMSTSAPGPSLLGTQTLNPKCTATKMNKRTYYALVAYAILFGSALALFISLFILVLIVVDLLFKAGFGYPAWSIVVAIIFVVLGLMMTKGAIFFLRRVRRM